MTSSSSSSLDMWQKSEAKGFSVVGVRLTLLGPVQHHIVVVRLREVALDLKVVDLDACWLPNGTEARARWTRGLSQCLHTHEQHCSLFCH